MMQPGPRALIVEDDRSWQQILSEILTDAGLAVEVADTLEEAVTSLRATHHRLAVVDLSLSGGDYQNQDGLHVLNAVRRYDPGCSTILLTGYATVELAVRSLTEYGALSCLRKESFDRAQFNSLVRQALASASPGPDTAAFAGDASIDGSPGHDTDLSLDDEPAPGQVLVVEDDAGWRSILSELLTDAGYEVRLCSSYGEALGCLRRKAYMLAVIDLSLEGPVMSDARLWGQGQSAQDTDGYRLLASTRESGIPTIVVSGIANPSDIERAYAEQGIFACLEKQSFDRRAFLRTIEEARAAVQASSELDSLTPREREVLELLARGLTNKEIATGLVITTNTVKRHLKAIFLKLDVHTRAAAVAKAIGAGLAAE